MKIHPHSKLIMVGDSITDCGRNNKEPLGSGYVQIVRDLLSVADSQLGIQVINKGIGGNTVRDLKNRWQRDVLDLNPDWLSIMIGINDVWQQMDNWLPTEECVSIAEYESTLDEILAEISPSLKRLILMTPYVLQPDISDPMRAMMDKYGGVVRKAAKKYDAIFINSQTVFDRALIEIDATGLSKDRIHMNRTGHTILARAFLKAIE